MAAGLSMNVPSLVVFTLSGSLAILGAVSAPADPARGYALLAAGLAGLAFVTLSALSESRHQSRRI